MRTVTARYLFPVAGPPLAGGLLMFEDGKIVAVEPSGTCTPDEDFGNAAILPGLVNAHTHLDLSGARGLIPPTDPNHFTDWLKGVITYRRTRTSEQVQQDIEDGLNEVLQSGTTLVGDITSGGASWDALSFSRDPKGSDLRAIVFHELIGLSEERAKESGSAAWNWYQSHPTTPTCRTAFSPHAPYSTSLSLLVGASNNEWTVGIHLAETAAELQLLKSHSGPFAEFLRSMGAWHPSELAPHLDRILTRNRLAKCALFIHCNYLPLESTRYFHGGMSIVYCPRTHAAFGHPPHPFREFLARGVRVCLGTDSLASNPDLDILAEARFVRSRYPDFRGDRLLKMITLSGAEALGWADECGSLEVGKSADFVVVPLPNRDESDPHDLFLKDDSAPTTRRTMFRGEWRE